jgi:hypothetical protein
MRRLAYLYRDVRVNVDNLVQDVGWQPKKDLLGALAKEICRTDARNTPSDRVSAQQLSGKPKDSAEIYQSTP